MHQNIPRGTAYSHFNRHLFPFPPAAAVAAITGFMTRLRYPPTMLWEIPQAFLPGFSQSTPHRVTSGSTSLSDGPSSQRWDCVWERCIGPGHGISHVDPANGLPRYYRPGSLEGAWEGLFAVRTSYLLIFLIVLMFSSMQSLAYMPQCYPVIPRRSSPRQQ